jgi:hypothetical protein
MPKSFPVTIIGTARSNVVCHRFVRYEGETRLQNGEREARPTPQSGGEDQQLTKLIPGRQVNLIKTVKM